MNGILLVVMGGILGCGKSLEPMSSHNLPPNLQLHVVPRSTKSQKPHYDTKKKEGQLDLLVEYHEVGERSSFSLASAKSSYLYTYYDQSHLDYPFDNEEARIFLKIPGEKIVDSERKVEVGRYLPALNFGALPLSDSGLLPAQYWESHARWITPILCEGAYESVCRVEVKIKKQQSVFTPDQKISVFLCLGEESKPVYEATSTQKEKS